MMIIQRRRNCRINFKVCETASKKQSKSYCLGLLKLEALNKNKFLIFQCSFYYGKSYSINKECAVSVDIRHCYFLQVPLSWKSQTLNGVMLLA